MVIAWHGIITAYGFWLPNDPRGSWSDFVRSWELLVAGGPATKTDDRRSLAKKPHDRRKRLEAKRALKYSPVEFTGEQALAIAHGFNRTIWDSEYVILACSIMPKHAHVVVARHEHLAERILGHLKARATQELLKEGLHPFEQYRRDSGRFPSVWASRAWKVFLDDIEDVRRAVRYAKNNPLKDGLPEQNWSFDTDVEEWIKSLEP